MLTQFVRFEVALQQDPTQLERAIAHTLQTYGEPLRWAITAVDETRQIAAVEAVVTISTRTV